MSDSDHEGDIPIGSSIHDEIVRQLRHLADRIENREVYIYHFSLTGMKQGQKLEIEVG